jgi:hypothetical protein
MSEVFKTGVLIKKSRNRGAIRLMDNWQERKINLMKDMVTYGPVDGPTKDSIPINMSTVVETSELSKDMGKSFKITTGDDELVLCCPDEFIRDEWIKAINEVAHDKKNTAAPAPAPAASGEDEKAKLAREAKEREESRLKALAGSAMAEYEKALAAFNKAQEDKKRAQAACQSPVECNKKLSTESSYKPRYIWVDPRTKEFFWAKSPDDVTKSKGISIVNHVKSVSYNTMEGESLPNMTVELNENLSDLPESVFATGMFKSALPSSVDITMTDAAMCQAFVTYLREIKNPPPAPEPPAKPSISMPSIGMPNVGGMSLGKMAANAAGVPTSASSVAHAAGVPTSASSALRSVV